MESSTVVSSKPTLELQATSLMCFHCFETLINNLRLSYPQLSSMVSVPILPSNTDHGKPWFLQDLPKENVTCPLFVTWEKKRGAAKSPFSFGGDSTAPAADVYELRGCIGTLSPLPVSTALTKYALHSALQDHRFTPIHPSELPLLRVAVSLLVQYEPCQNAYDWTVGTHGIIIQFTTANGATFSATYLPEVALEQKWDPPTAVASLIRKSGYNQAITPELIQSIECTRYQSSKIKMTLEEYWQQYQQLNPQAQRMDPAALASSMQQHPTAAAGTSIA
eukprot:CAMPEP_0172467436 /NCGR_PEP_ID=MMETSP1065-20121228/58919_1 /TAXON_ID=265537 /ORGANISM="Amphiprora paludosa, Strain CCMP125" /LENGTH=277 /DNA_ID=CAMNT_0013224567 /DNA_START=75 /DNA_END=905 /DNA_ORIENTATION=+